MNDVDNNQFRLSWEVEGRNTVIFYLSSMCSSCTKHLPVINKIINTFEDDKWRFLLLWEDSIPWGSEFANAMNLVLNEDVALAGSTPYVFIVNDKGIVEFSGEYTARDFVQMMIQRNGRENYIKSCIDTLPINYLEDKKCLFAFHTNGCSQCYESSIELNKEDTQRKYNIILYSDMDRNNIVEFDSFGFYSEMFNIQQYPAYLIIDTDKSYDILDSIL